MLLLGVDEAGYGPLLGPLCVGASAWTLDRVDAVDLADPAAAPPNLWTMLRTAVCRAGKDARGRLPIADSKKLKLAKGTTHHPLTHLERTVLACAAVSTDAASIAATDDALRLHLGDDRPAWPGGVAIDLPVATDRALATIGASQLRLACAKAGVRLRSLRCVRHEPCDLNAHLATGALKPNLTFCTAMEFARRELGAHPGVPTWLAFDRQGGRMRYLDDLLRAFDARSPRILHEDEERSHYLLTIQDRPVRISFEVGAESRHLPIALASMTAKLVRELCMERFNRYFAREAPAVAPTAGYVKDGRRWLHEMAPHWESLGIRESDLVRNG